MSSVYIQKIAVRRVDQASLVHMAALGPGVLNSLLGPTACLHAQD